ncbi:nucleoporin NUP42 isoform X2 [Amia ocellicauda]|uniref:nucleoporin NUP42 isoform X2 n=1 Tax=Amia ocellicauda TaxID=2972642 RepID=UPI003464BF57
MSTRRTAAEAGFGNRVWINPSQRTPGSEYIQASSFSRQGDWGRGGGARDEARGGFGGPSGFGQADEGRKSFSNTGSSSFSFSSQNHFSALNTQQDFDRGSAGDDAEKHLDTIKKDMESWESSGQWIFSCYSALKNSISGFPEFSPEELRLEYYNSRASGDLQNYVNSVQQLINQWKNRLLELKTQNSATRADLISELTNPSPKPSSVQFGALVSSSFGSGGFGAGAPQSSSSSTFSFQPTGGFGSAATQGGTVASQPLPTIGASGSGFGSTSAPASAASFSFAAPTADKEQPSGFGAPSGFGFSSSFGASAAPSSVAAPTNSFGQSGGGFGGSGSTAVASASTGAATGKLFTPQSELSAEELKEFGEKRFTLGKIPLRPPPADLLSV